MLVLPNLYAAYSMRHFLVWQNMHASSFASAHTQHAPFISSSTLDDPSCWPSSFGVRVLALPWGVLTNHVWRRYVPYMPFLTAHIASEHIVLSMWERQAVALCMCTRACVCVRVCVRVCVHCAQQVREERRKWRDDLTYVMNDLL
jgi:hypothetical protein